MPDGNSLFDQFGGLPTSPTPAHIPVEVTTTTPPINTPPTQPPSGMADQVAAAVSERMYLNLVTDRNAEDARQDPDRAVAEARRVASEMFCLMVDYIKHSVQFVEHLQTNFSHILQSMSVDDPVIARFAHELMKQREKGLKMATKQRRRIKFRTPYRMPSIAEIEAIPADSHEAWKKIPIARMTAVTPSVEEALVTHGIHRLGQLYCITRHIDQSPARYAWPPKIGPTIATDLKTEMQRIIQKHESLSSGQKLTEMQSNELQDRVKELQTVGDYVYHSDSSVWSAGAASHSQGFYVLSCPWLPGDRRDDWIRGWLWDESRTRQRAQGFRDVQLTKRQQAIEEDRDPDSE